MSQEKNKQSKEQYIIVPFWLVNMTSNKKSAIYLTPFELNLYCLIKGLSEKKPCYAKNKYFADIFNVSIKHINKSIQKLNDVEFIKIEHINNKRFIQCNKKISKESIYISFLTDQDLVNITTQKKVIEYSITEWWNLNESNNLTFDLLQ